MITPFEKLPIELLSPIFDGLATWDLLSVALTCKGFAAIAVPILYKSIHIRTSHRQLAHSFVPIEESSAESCGSDPIPVNDKLRLSKWPSHLSCQDSGLPPNRKAQSAQLFRLLLMSPDKSRHIVSLSVTIKSALYSQYDGPKPLSDSEYRYIYSLNPITRSFFAESIHLDRLTTLKIPYDWLFDLPRLMSLQSLGVKVRSVATTRTSGVFPELDVPSLETFKINFYLIDATQEGFKLIVEGLFYLLSQFPYIRKLKLKATTRVSTNANDYNPVYSEISPDHVRLLQGLTLPSLEAINIGYSAFIDKKFYVDIKNISTSSGGRIRSFHDIIVGFVNRHGHQLRAIDWRMDPLPQELLDLEDGPLPENRIILQPFPNARTLRFGSMPTWSLSCYNWFAGFVEEQRQASSLEEFYFETEHHEMEEGWFDYFPKFSNVTRLKIANDCWKTPRAYFDSVFSVFYSDNAGQMMACLPPRLQMLDVLVGISRSFEGAEYQHFGLDEIFENMTALGSVKVDFQMHKLHWILIMRRRPVDIMDPTPTDKRVCVWHLRPIHRETPLPFKVYGTEDEEDEDYHVALVGYREFLLVKWNYLGPDAAMWKMDEVDVRRIRQCRADGVGGCDHLLMRKGVWVPAPRIPWGAELHGIDDVD